MKRKSLVSQAFSNLGKMRGCGKLTREKNLGNIARFLNLVEDKYGLERLTSLKTKHIEGVFNELRESGLSASTLSAYATAARIIARMIGKENIVPRTNSELGASRAGERLKPTETDLQQQLLIQNRLYEKAQWLGLAHELRLLFGLRTKESLLSNQTVERNGKQYLLVRGTKGGRLREVEVRTDDQRKIIERIRRYIEENGGNSIIPPEFDLRRAYNCQKNALYSVGARRKLKTNAHALRHAYAQNRDQETNNRSLVAEELGHSRRDVVSHYAK